MPTSPSIKEQSRPAIPNQPKVAIMMGTFNGERFLAEQLESIKQQTHKNWELHISDDGSTDNTRNIIENITESWLGNPITLRAGPQSGFVKNFLSLGCDSTIQADYYAFSDQDDVWESNKLMRAIDWLKTISNDKPALYCSRTRLIDESGQPTGYSPLFKRKPSFQNALVQSIAGANTMVFNNAARRLLAEAGADISVASHDWWLYLLVTGCGGEVIYDATSSISYRQHASNLVGSNTGLRARMKRISASLIADRFAQWNGINTAALQKVWSSLSVESRDSLKKLIEIRAGRPFARVLGLANSGLYRQTTADNAGLFIMTLVGKI